MNTPHPPYDEHTAAATDDRGHAAGATPAAPGDRTAAHDPYGDRAAGVPYPGGAPGARRHGIGRLRRVPRWAVPVIGAGIGLACGAGYGVTAPPQYAATAYVLVVPQHTGDAQTALGFAQAYGRITTGPAVLAGAQDAAGQPAARLRGAVQSATSPDAPMIAVTGTARTGTAAARIADAVAGSLTATGNRTASSTGVRLLVFSRAAAPASPSSPSPALAGAVGACAGGLLGALALLVRPRGRDDEAGGAAVDAPAVPAPGRERTLV